MPDTDTALTGMSHGWFLWLFRPGENPVGKIRPLSSLVFTSGVALVFQRLTLHWGIIEPPESQAYEILNYSAPFVVSLLGFLLFPNFNGLHYASLISWILRIFCIHSTFVVLLALVVGHELEESLYYENKASWERSRDEHLDAGKLEETFTHAEPTPPNWSAFRYSFVASGALLILLISLATGSGDKGGFSGRILDPPNRPNRSWSLGKRMIRTLARCRVKVHNLYWSIAEKSRLVRGFHIVWRYVIIYVILVGMGRFTGFLSPGEHWWIEHWPSETPF